MPKYKVFCKSYYRKLTGKFIETKSTSSPSEDEFEYEQYGKEDWEIKVKMWGCGIAAGYELTTDVDLPCINPWEDKKLRIYRLDKCNKCGCPKDGSPLVEAELIEEDNNIFDIDWGFDYYEVLRLKHDCSKDDIRKRYTEYSLKFHSDKYKGKSEAEKKAADLRFKDIGKAYEMLIDDKARKRYNDAYEYMPFQCTGCIVGGVSRKNGVRSKTAARWFHDPDCAKAWCKTNEYSPVSVHGWNDDESFTPPPPGDSKTCAGCGAKRPTGPMGMTWDMNHGWTFCSDKCNDDFFQKLRESYNSQIRKLNKLTKEEKQHFINLINTGIPGNFDNILDQAKKANQDKDKKSLRACAGCGQKKPFSRFWWHRWSENSKEDYSCTSKCLFDYWTKRGTCPDGKPPRMCFYCGIVKKEQNDTTWVRDNDKNSKVYNLIFCSLDHLKEQKNKKENDLGGFGGGGPDLNKKRQEFIMELVGLDGWDKLSESEQDGFVKQVNSSKPDRFPLIKAEVLKAINIKKGKHSSLQDLKNSAIAEIDSELLKDPEVVNSELEPSNQNWGVEIQNAINEDQVGQIKKRVLDDIKIKRQAKEIIQLRNDAINLIRQELSKDPKVDEAELTNQNWEKDLANAKTKKAIADVRDWVLADLRSKRKSKQEEEQILNLLIKAKQATNFEQLDNIIKQIKKLRSSNAYKKHKQEIDQQEARLKAIDHKKYQKGIKDSLDEQLKNNGLNKSDVEDDTQRAIDKAIETGKSEDKDIAEEKIAYNGAKVNLKRVLIEINQKLQKNPTKNEKEELITKLLQFIAENNYTNASYRALKPEVDKLLVKLRGEDSQDSSTSPRPFPKQKIFLSLFVIGLLGMGITGILMWRKRKQKKMDDNRKV